MICPFLFSLSCLHHMDGFPDIIKQGGKECPTVFPLPYFRINDCGYTCLFVMGYV